jgi:hypothetical protein
MQMDRLKIAALPVSGRNPNVLLLVTYVNLEAHASNTKKITISLGGGVRASGCVWSDPGRE